jgi:hypothetical protein
LVKHWKWRNLLVNSDHELSQALEVSFEFADEFFAAFLKS